jgi:serine/threonine protein kinase/tetratricopeptide (TPR) repeat protein
LSNHTLSTIIEGQIDYPIATNRGSTSMLADTAIPVVGKRYLLHEQLGKGGMGAVYRATDRLTGQEVAVKRVYVPTSNLRFTSYSQDANSDDLRLALAQEFRVMASLRHPNIASVLDYGFDDARQPYFAMELFKDAQSLFRAAWKSDDDKANMLIQIMQALAYLHRRAIIHRDLKPGNILVSRGQIKVLDFGLSVTREQIDPNSDIIAGTVDYIAPEIFWGDPPSELSDLYAVGVIGYELFANKTPWSAEVVDGLVEEIVNKTPDMSVIPNRAIVPVLMQLLSKRPEQRYASAEEAIEALSAAIGQPAPAETAAIRESYLQAARFVGRETELSTLVSTLNQARSGQGSTWLIGGESGVGKTRLVDELRTQALVQGILVLRGRNTSEGHSPYQMWRAALRWLCLLTELDATELGILKALVPDLDSLLGQDITEASSVNPLFAQERLLHVVESVFRRQQQPILLILEDLHWAGSESLNLLRRLNQFIHELPLTIIGTYRNDERPDLEHAVPEAQVMELRRLDEHSIVELSEAILGEQGRQPQLLAFLQRETEGNVFFLVEVVRSLAERAGQLGQIHDMTLPEHVMAGGIKQIIQNRLNRVPAPYRPTLQIAAVAGRELDLKILRQLAGEGFDLEDWLTVCANTAVLEIHDETWRFAHDKLRDGVLDDLPEERKRELHRQIAAAIETVYLYSPEYIPSVAYHWTMAGDTAKEAHYAALAGKQALSSSAYQEAVQFLERALTLAGTQEAYGKANADLKRQTGEAYLGLGEYQRAKQRYQEYLQICQQIDYQWGIAAALSDLGNVAFMLEEFAESRKYFQQALKTAMGTRAIPIALASIAGIANLLANDGQPEHALELASFVLNQSVTDRQTAYRAGKLLSELKSRLVLEQFDAATERGKAGYLGEVANAILEA